MSTSFGHTFSVRHISGASYALLSLGALVLSSPAAIAARRPCDCDNLEQIEQHIDEQEFLRSLFKQWSEYMPNSLHTPGDVRRRANELFQLAFYGAATEVPHGTGSGAGASAGTLLNPDEHCPLVKYLYDNNGNAVIRETSASRQEHRNPPELEHAWKRITPAQYESHECAAIVRYTLAHEKHHQDTCQSSDTPKSSWDNPRFFVNDDLAAYQVGLDILYAERERLKRRCKQPPGDGRWHGMLEYAYIYADYGSETIEKGKDIVHPNGAGEKQWGTRKSVRARAFVDAPTEGGNIKLNYRASRQESWFDKGTFVMPSECGSFRQTVWKLNNGTETRVNGKISGPADGVLQADESVLSISYRVPDMLDGTFTRHEWDKPEGYCQEQNNRQIDNSAGHIQTALGFSVSMKVKIDPKHPNDIEVVQLEPDSSGKGQYLRVLRLHREPAE
jgi:hypothetical protein